MSARECKEMERAIAMWRKQQLRQRGKPLSVEAIAEKCGVSRSGLYKALERNGYR